jgi:hypothetical protein
LLNKSVKVAGRRRKKGQISNINSKFIPVNRFERASQELLSGPPRRMKIKDAYHRMVITDDTGADTHLGNKMVALTRSKV